MTNYERIKAMTPSELAAFLRSCVDPSETHEVACYGCVHFGTHHSDPDYKDAGLYECEDCACEGVGLDVEKWLMKEQTDGDRE